MLSGQPWISLKALWSHRSQWSVKQECWTDAIEFAAKYNYLWKVEEEALDETVANRGALPDPEARVIKRGDERLSLTVRRVQRVKNILGARK